ncbi:MAG: hypothetical protein ABI432_19505 [Flavobacteriales bacterium]
MTEGHRSPVLPVLVFSTICTAATWLALRITGYALSWPFAVVLVWFALISLVLLSWQERAWGADVQPFVRRFMAGLVIKLLASLALLFILVKTVPKPVAAPLVASFALLYLAFLGFSTAWLIGRMRSVPRP